MQRIFDFEGIIAGEVLSCLPAKSGENEFFHKYIYPNPDLIPEEDASRAFGTCEEQAFYAGFRIAAAMFSGRKQIYLDELICKRI